MNALTRLTARALTLLTLSALATLGACGSPGEVGGDHDRVGLASAEQQRALREAGADPSLNDSFRSADLDVQAFIDRFEGESREVAVERDELVAALALHPGEQLADIGAGTGLFLEPFNQAVGARGQVYAVDISEGFMEHMQARIAEEGLERVTPVLCDDRSTGLEPGSVDAVFVCDTYHHFEHPFDTLRSIREALRPGGRMLIVDFERIPGVTKPWLLEHVRCGKQTVIAEVTAAGFRLDAELEIEGLSENYVLRFVRGE
ncbi:MAG: SAM-dependent methyltransferase [Planctomycetota bacterium]|nr:MAG: SAM-dependent methyltransferase [Planctomycetota bacterium]